jgi:hypothetical protein
VLPPKDGYQQPYWRQDIEQYKDKSNTPSIWLIVSSVQL